MNKRKQKQLRRLLAAKRAEKQDQKCGQIELKNLQGQVWDLAVQSQQIANQLKTQAESLRLCNRFFLKEIKRLEKYLTADRIGDVVLSLLGGMIGGMFGVFMWILCIL